MFATSAFAQSSLIGSNITIDTILQSEADSQPQVIGVKTTVPVAEPVVEFPSLKAIQGPGLELVDVAINVGADFLEIDFDNVTDPQFGDAYFNGYVFTLADDVAFNFIAATVDATATTIGLDNDDVVLSGNQLSINVQGQIISPALFARINLISADQLEVLDTINSLGQPTTTKIRGGISLDDGVSYATSAVAEVGDDVLIDFVVEPEAQHTDQTASILVAVQDQTTGVITLLGADGLFYAIDLANVVSFDQVTLQAGNLIQVVTGNGITVGSDLLGTDGAIFIGYMIGGEIYYSQQPLEIKVE